MFQIQCYKNSLAKEVVDKKTILEEQYPLPVILEGVLKAKTSIVNPTVIIEAEHLTFNYCHIPEFKRWYYVVDIVSIATNLWEVQMKVDVLNTFQNGIKNQMKCCVMRNETNYNSKIEDNRRAFSLPIIRYVRPQQNNFFVGWSYSVQGFQIDVPTDITG